MTGDNSLLTQQGLDITSTSGYLQIHQNQIQMNVGYDSAIITPTAVSVQGASDNQVNHFNNKIEFVESLVTVNTLDHNWSGGIKTEATLMSANHYLLGSMTAATSSDKPQKNSNIYFNPSLLTLYSPVFSGTLQGTADTSKAISTFTSNVTTTCYIPFFNSAAGTNKVVYLDDTTGPLTYVPSTGVLSATNFTGSLTGTASAATLAANSSNLNLAITLNLATFTLGTTLTITGATATSFKNSNIIFTGTSNTVSILTLVTTQVNGEYSCGFLNSGTGNLVFNTGLGTNIKTTYSSNVNISPGAYGLLTIRVMTINALTVYIVSVNQLTG